MGGAFFSLVGFPFDEGVALGEIVLDNSILITSQCQLDVRVSLQIGCLLFFNICLLMRSTVHASSNLSIN